MDHKGVSDTWCCKPSIHPVGSGLRTSATQSRAPASAPQRTSLLTRPIEKALAAEEKREGNLF
jgi:hypothetical protein